MISFRDLIELNRHGVPKNATKAELKAIRSNPRSSKGAKQLAHWKLNMHHKEEVNESCGKADLILPRGEQKVLEAEDKDYKRGMLVKLIEDGGYEMHYWYKEHKPAPIEVLVDGKSIKKDAKKVTMKFHPDDYYDEGLDDWFNKEKWVRMDTKGNIKGDCAREPGEGKPKCLPKAKAQSMSKDDRAKAARRKRREDPQVDRPGTGNKPINVKTEGLDSDASYEERKKKNKDLFGDRYKETGRHKRDHEAERRRLKKEYGKGSKEYNKHMSEEEKMVSHEYSSRMKQHGKMSDEQKKAVTAVYDKGKVDKKMLNDPHVKRAMKYMRTEELNAMFEKCWDGWKQMGMKKKGKRMVPNCVKEDWLLGGIMLEASKPNNPKLWSQAKAAARAKYDVYPSAYANGFAVKWYKKRGGTWRGKKD